MVFKIFLWNVPSFCRGINMRYLGKVAAILALRADLEHVHVSVAYWCFVYKWLELKSRTFNWKKASNCKLNYCLFPLLQRLIMDFCEVPFYSCHLLLKLIGQCVDIDHLWVESLLQKIAVMEMIIRTVKQLFKLHMQSGEWWCLQKPDSSWSSITECCKYGLKTIKDFPGSIDFKQRF